MNAEQLVSEIQRDTQEIAALTAHRDVLLQAWAEQVSPHKVDDVIERKHGACIKARVTKVTAALDWNKKLRVHIALRPLKKDGTDSARYDSFIWYPKELA